MKHNLVVFAFFSILLALTYHFLFAELYDHFFSAERSLQNYWIIPFVVVPALLQLGLAWLMGFGRRGGPRWADAAALVIIMGVVFLNLDASYSCGSGCF
jgi:hypothetical protein